MNRTIIPLIILLSACSANRAIPQASYVELINEVPDKSRCRYLGEIVGSQGNWFTGDFTSNENLIIGARNELRNKAYQLGGNVVHVQNMSNTNAWGSLGTTNTTVVGKAYRCR
ncbi:DUF4156 domain-containing protein [Alteromonas ponticola]|uniref:DUF4156 domain-containing protein n=1 Tax=Alteromonas aquimaris TaxID=2998417 RepID=A0ABT3P6K5_9ALTE|nr:DUF4156 domain-containing protein [Alteromonas aquimaris]MCW8108380.1 DUF4156 domain-containing protein [Alteromonas aquimaris]